MSLDAGISSIGSVSLESIPDVEKPRKHGQIPTTRYRWHSSWEFITFTIASAFTVHAFEGFTAGNRNDTEPNIMHYIITCSLVGLPIYYLQVIVGQYTQLSTISYKHIGPIGHSIGVALIVNALLDTIKNAHLLTKFIVYLLASLQTRLRWLECSPDTLVGCWSPESNCTKNCVSKGVHLSADIYYSDIICDNPILDPKKMRLTFSPTTTIIRLSIIWILTTLFLVYAMTNYRKVVKYTWIIILIFLGILFIGCVVTRQNLLGVQRLVNVRWLSLFRIEAWSKTIFTMIGLFGLGKPFHTLHGSYMSNKQNAQFYCIISWSLLFLLNCFCSILTHTCLALIEVAAHLDRDHVKHIFPARSELEFFVVIPQALGILGIRHLWTVMYFLTGTFILMINQVVYINVIETCLREAYPALTRYRKYMLAFYCLICFVFGTISLSKESYLIYLAMYFIVPDELENLNIIAMCLLVCLFYGVQTFCDDVHFLTGYQPSIYWKICWCCATYVTIGANVTLFSKRIKLQDNNTKIMNLIIYAIYLSPSVIVGFMEIFRFVKERNMVGLFQAEERYGPEDPDERRLRRMFNPRREIRSKRRNDRCQHRCLLGSKVLLKIIDNERKFREECSSNAMKKQSINLYEED